MKKLKKILSMLICVSVASVNISFPLSVKANGLDIRTNAVDLRVGFLNDTHITATGSGEEGAVKALTVLKNIGMEKLAFVGDNVYYTSASDDPSTNVVGYNKLKSAVSNAGWKWDDLLVYAMGNHEFPQANRDAEVSATSIRVFEEQTGFERRHHTEYNNIHFISAAPESYDNNFSSETEKYIMQEIDKALCEDSTNEMVSSDGEVSYEGGTPNSTTPIFLILHQPIGNTINNGENNLFSADFINFLATRPQVVNITAHMHRLAQHPEVICQDAGFTVFQSSLTSGGFHSQWGYTKQNEITDKECSQGSFVEVKDNVVYLYRLDYVNECYIGEPFVVDIPSIVKERLDDNKNNDQDHMPYRTEIRNNVGSTASFPAGATVSAQPQGNGVMVSFTNNATMTSFDSVQQDDFVRGYRVEVLMDGIVVGVNEFQTDFWKLPSNRAKEYTKSVGGLLPGKEYIVKVYPRTPFGAYGIPISTNFETEPELENEDNNSIRYEIEDYCTIAKLNQETAFASGNGLCMSAQGGMVAVVELLRKDVSESPFKIEIPVEIPTDGYYGIELAMGYNSGTSVSEVTMILDNDIVLAKSTTKGDEDLSLDGTYPWKHIPLMHYTASDQYLTKGKHSVTVSVAAPKMNDTQPYLFCADYIEFIPRTHFINLNRTKTIEIEDCISNVIVPENDGTPYTPTISSSVRCSGGKYAMFDSTDNQCSVDYVDISIPLFVEDEGYYDVTSVSCNTNPGIKIYLDSDTENALNKDYIRVKDEARNLENKYTYFNSSWAIAYIDTIKAVYLSEGTHNVIIRLGKRADGDIAQYLDYIRFTPATDVLNSDGFLHYEAEDYQSSFESDFPEIASCISASDGELVYESWASGNVKISFSINVNESGTYALEFVGTYGGALSKVDVNVDGIQQTLTKVEDLYTYKVPYTLKKYIADISFDKGLHVLTFTFNARSDASNTAAYALDYIHLSKKCDAVVSQVGSTGIEFENFMNYNVQTFEFAREGKYISSDNGDNSTKPEIKALVEIRESGYYDVEYLVGNKDLGNSQKNASDVKIYLGDVLIGANNDSHYENLQSNDGFYWGVAPMCRYFKENIWLDAGVYELNVMVDVPETQNTVEYNYQMDYIEFHHSDSVVQYGISYLTAHLSSKDVMNGKMFFAFYSNGSLVKLETKDVTNSRYANISADISDLENVTHVKAFIIELSTLKPLTVFQEYKVTE